MKTQEKMKAKARRQTNRQLVAREQYRKGHWIRLLATLSMPHYNLSFELTEVAVASRSHKSPTSTSQLRAGTGSPWRLSRLSPLCAPARARLPGRPGSAASRIKIAGPSWSKDSISPRLLPFPRGDKRTFHLYLEVFARVQVCVCVCVCVSVHDACHVWAVDSRKRGRRTRPEPSRSYLTSAINKFKLRQKSHAIIIIYYVSFFFCHLCVCVPDVCAVCVCVWESVRIRSATLLELCRKINVQQL